MATAVPSSFQQHHTSSFQPDQHTSFLFTGTKSGGVSMTITAESDASSYSSSAPPKPIVRQPPKVLSSALEILQDEEVPSLTSLPYDILQAVLSHLSPVQLAAVCQVNRQLYFAATDNSLWKTILNTEMAIWPTVTSDTMPGHFAVERMARDTYMRCSPMVPNRTHFRLLNYVYRRSSSLSVLSRILPQRRLRVAMFGPGLEASARGLLNDLMWLPTSPFRLDGMIPGRDGIGGGVSLLLGNTFRVDLVTLYQKTAAERSRNDDTDQGRFENQLSNSAKDVCRNVDAFIFVADANKLATEATAHGDHGTPEQHRLRCVKDVRRFVNPGWTEASAPLVVWSCTRSENPDQWSAVQVANGLHLPGLARPWMVQHVPVDNFGGPVVKAMSWLFEASKK